MRPYLDHNITDRRIVAHMQRAGHAVVLPVEVGHAGVSDAKHFTAAIRQRAVLLTQNYKDFIELHDLILAAGGSHPGLLLLYTENDLTRDMTAQSITVAVSRVEAAAVPLVNHVYALNYWR